MAGRIPPSDLGSDWVTVPRKFRGVKDTSSPTELAYLTRPEIKAIGLLTQAGKRQQVGPSNIPSFDDSGMYEEWSGKKGDKPTKFTGILGGSKTVAPTKAQGGVASHYKTLDTIKKSMRGGGTGVGTRDERGWKPDLGAGKPLSDQKNIFGKHVDKTKDSGSFISRDWDRGGDDVDEDNKTGGDIKTTVDPCQGRGRNPDGSCKSPTEPGDVDKCKDVVIPNCPEDKPHGRVVCNDGNLDYSGCSDRDETSCDYGRDENGNCKPKPEDEDGDEDGGGPGDAFLTPDETPVLYELTEEMDLRNMLGNVLNKNNPLFKQARTRALQAMAARGIVNSSMAEEAVMGAIMNVAMPIATRVIDDLQKVMMANANAGNEFKMALNKAYYDEIIARVNNAANYQMNFMMQSQENWRSVMDAMSKGAGISDTDQFNKYMEMIKGGYTTPSKGR